MRILKYILFVSVVFLTACSDFLDETPKTGISIDFIYNTPEGLESGLVGVYNFNRDIFHIWPDHGSKTMWPYVQNDLVIPAAGYQSIIGQFASSATSPDLHGAFVSSLMWKDNYKIIDRANALIEAAEAIQGMNEDARNTVLAESKYFRAHSLFTLYRLYNNVYVKTTSTTPENVFDKIETPNTKEEIFTAINEDLQFAIEHLPWTAQAGRVTQATARHVRAKSALWTEDYDIAAAQADSIINSGHYSLVQDLKTLFGHPDTPGHGKRNHEEAIFTIQNESGSTGTGPPHRMNAIFLARYNEIPGAKWDNEQGGNGWGFIFPNSYLFSLYESFDKRLDAYYIRDFYYNDEPNIPDSVLTDDGWVYPELGDKIVTQTTGTHFGAYTRRHGPSLAKFFDEDIPESTAVSYQNILFYRLSETHLIGAEAYMRMGMQGKALAMINPLLERAGVPPLFSINENELMREHAKELAIEGHRFYFLKRIGKLVSQVQKYSGEDNYKADARSNIRPHHINLPIPTSELNQLGPNYPQNEGY